jgi:membrane protein required for colicin V production
MDLAILIILALMTLRGFIKGIILETSAFFGLLISFFLASLYYRNLGLLLIRYLPTHETLLAVFCFILIFLACFFILRMLATAARGAVRLAFLGWLDRILGGFFGFIKGVVIIVLLVTLLLFLRPKTSPLVKGSRLFPPLQTVTEKIILFIPLSIKEDFETKKKRWEEYWKKKEKDIKDMGKIRDHE